MEKPTKRAFMVGIVIILLVFYVLYLLNNSKNKEGDLTGHHQKETLNDEDINNHLPLTIEVQESGLKPLTVTYRLWSNLMDKFKESGHLSSASILRYQFLDGDDHEFNMAVIFQVHLGEGIEKTSWGHIQENGLVRDLVWKLHVEKDSDRNYTLKSIEKLTDKFIGLPPIQNAKSYKEEVGIEEPNPNYRYEIVDERLRVTYNNGNDWVEVPVSIEELFEGDYNGPMNNLLEGSYVISLEKTAFVVGGSSEIRLLLTTDHGNTWDEVFITNELPGARLRLLGFTSEQDGYLILTGYRTMSAEGHLVFKTNDGGYSWHKEGAVDTSRMVKTGGFINKELGFISFGPIQPEKPNLYRTSDGGRTFEKVKIPIPEEFQGIFTVAEMPVFNGNLGTLLVNQGPNGDYLGGKILAKFKSDDNGLTWTFAGLVDIDGVLGD